MTTTTWTDVTMNIGGVDYPVPVLEVAESRVRAGLEEALRADPLFQMAFECRVRFDAKMRRALSPTRGQRRAARRRQRGRERAMATRWLRKLDRAIAYRGSRRRALPSSPELARVVRARSLGRG